MSQCFVISFPGKSRLLLIKAYIDGIVLILSFDFFSLQDIVMGKYVLRHTVGDRETVFKFHRNLLFRAGQDLTVSDYIIIAFKQIEILDGYFAVNLFAFAYNVFGHFNIYSNKFCLICTANFLAMSAACPSAVPGIQSSLINFMETDHEII